MAKGLGFNQLVKLLGKNADEFNYSSLNSKGKNKVINELTNEFNQRGAEAAEWAGLDYGELSLEHRKALITRYNKHLDDARVASEHKSTSERKQELLDKYKQKSDNKIIQTAGQEYYGEVYDENAQAIRATELKAELKNKYSDEQIKESHIKQRRKIEQQERQVPLNKDGQAYYDSFGSKLDRQEELSNKRNSREQARLDREQARLDKEQKKKSNQAAVDTERERREAREKAETQKAYDEAYNARYKYNGQEHDRRKKELNEVFKAEDKKDKAAKKAEKLEKDYKDKQYELNTPMMRKKLDSISEKGKEFISSTQEILSGSRRNDARNFANKYNETAYGNNQSDFIGIKEAKRLQKKYEGKSPVEVFYIQKEGMLAGAKNKISDIADKAEELASGTDFMEYIGQAWDWATQDTQHAMLVAGGAVGVGILGSELFEDDDDYY